MALAALLGLAGVTHFTRPKFYDAIVRTIDRIAEMPDAGLTLGTLKARRMLVTGFPYQIVYRVDSDEIRILAFAHLKRRPGFWRRRR